MYISQQSDRKLFFKRSMLVLSLLTATPLEVFGSEESSLSTSTQQKIDIFRKEVPQSEINTLDFSPSKQGKKALCHLSNKTKKTVWIDKEVLDKVEENTVLEALQKGYHDKSVTCKFKEMAIKAGKFDGIVAYPEEGQIVFYDVTSKKE